MNILDALAYIEQQVGNPKNGLPLEIFYSISRLVPMVNVDLLIKDENNRTLLAWRDDEFAGTGWHVPGGIVRFKETLENRINKVAEIEIGAKVNYESEPVAVNQVICDHNTRGHFISLLYKCTLPESYVIQNGPAENEPGFLKWHGSCPENLVDVHKMYRSFI